MARRPTGSPLRDATPPPMEPAPLRLPSSGYAQDRPNPLGLNLWDSSRIQAAWARFRGRSEFADKERGAKDSGTESPPPRFLRLTLSA